MTSKRRRRRGDQASRAPRMESAAAVAARERPPRRDYGARLGHLGPTLLVVFATGFAYLPVLGNGFVDFDDQTNLVENPSFRGLGAEALRWMFTNLDGHYLPLTWLSFALDHALWGMNPFGFHLTNLVLHLANTLAFAWLSARLLRLAFGLRPGDEPASLYVAAAVSAGLFALHPLRVESVAWATERRDVLSGLFFLLAVGAYVGVDGRGVVAPSGRSAVSTPATAAGPTVGTLHSHEAPRFPWRALGLYSLSLLAKPVGMTLPVVLVVLDVYPLGRLPGRVRDWWRPDRRHVWLEKLPFVALGTAAAVVEGVAERHVDTFYSLAQYGLAGRIGQAFFAPAFYLWKMVLPVGLSPLYQLPVGWRFLRPDVLAGLAVVLTLTLGLVRLRRRWPWALAVWVTYVAMLAPVLGFVQAGPHIAADRYTYLASLGWAVVAGGLVFALARAEAAGRVARGRYRLAIGGAMAVALVLGALTWRQVGVWHDSLTLWRTAVTADPQCYICLNNLGNAFLRAGRAAEAAPQFAAAARIQPEDADVHANLGNVAQDENRIDEARREFEAALRLDPGHPVAHVNLARLLINDGRPEEALPHLEAALRRDPMSGEAYGNLGLALMARGDVDGAERALRQALRIQPDSAIAHSNLGILLLRREASAEAEREFRRATELDPAFPEAWFNLGLTLADADRRDEAIAVLDEAVRLRPGYARAHQKLAQLLLAAGRQDDGLAHAAKAAEHAPDTDATALALSYMEAGRRRDAIGVLRKLLERSPEDGEAMNMLAWLLATAREDDLRDGATAVTLAERAVAAAGQEADADQLDTLAAAYAEVGRFPDAVAAARRARAAAAAAGNQEFVDEVDARLALYQQKRAFRSE